ncbi:pilus assembly protein TadG-related protein [Candidatus Clostridium radicumherbarum]|uniref:Pilus assembly protein TadG-related protein n=1 Tax=Candidatus Clostridium radicumherbarum TaxID=3381662 RepID=A0ABW8TRC9_9CLOT
MIEKFKLYKEEDGIGLVWFALTFVVIAFMTGLAIDGGRLYLSKIELRKTADAAALSGASELTGTSTSITNIVNGILSANNELSSLKELDIKPNGENKVKVILEKNVPLYFMKIFGFNNTPVDVSSTAAIFPMTETTGVVPFGIPQSMVNDPNFTFGTEYTLKVGAGDSISGNFGILALADTGASSYLDVLKNGYNQPIEIGKTIDTQTGNIAENTIKGVNYRIQQSPYTQYDETHKDDPRIIKILVYTPNGSSNQIKSITVTGFAYFYLADPMSSHDTTVKGFFIRQTGVGTGSSDVVDNGAYAAKLVE